MGQVPVDRSLPPHQALEQVIATLRELRIKGIFARTSSAQVVPHIWDRGCSDMNPPDTLAVSCF